MDGSKQFQLFINSDVRTVLEKRRLKDEDLRKTITEAEQTGRKFFHPESRHFLAGIRQDAATVWVEYGPRESGYEVYSAYMYRLEVSAWDYATGRTR